MSVLRHAVILQSKKVIVCVVALLVIAPFYGLAADSPDFAAYTDVKQKKRAFFNYLHPKIQKKNAAVLQDRKRIIKLQTKPKSALKAAERTWLQTLAKQYNIAENLFAGTISPASWSSLLSKVDIIPASLALAQAANESAWGTSRFARKGQNYFGQWCYSKGCGLVPARREAGSTHEVRRFKNADASVAAYINNLNRNLAFKELRQIRKKLRATKSPITGHALAAGLSRYSARKAAYVKELRSMIRFNKLEAFASLPAKD